MDGAVAEDAQDGQGRLEADASFFIGGAQQREAAQGAGHAGAVLRERARQAEPLLGVMAGAAEPQARPGAPLGHLRQQAAEAALEIVLQGEELADLRVQIGGAAAAG